MPRFFVAGTNIGNGIAVITGTDANHAKVLRLKIGDEIIICDGEGTDHRCRITRMSADEVETEVCHSERSAAEPSVYVTVLAGYPKGERADFIVQKCVETGASEIVFFKCDRCVAKPDPKSIDKKLQRFNRIAEEAAKQSGRGIIPEVKYVDSYAEALDIAVKTELPLFMYETGDRITLREALEGTENIKTAAIITGPEGGFERYEADLAAKVGIKLCAMGPRIFRCETAPMAALTALMYASGNM